MGGEPKSLSGPDLEQGVPWSELGEGRPLLGHAFGEAVVVVRRGEEALATGASCTHYGGPLAEGLVVGDTIRCPWHHARFDLRSGEAVGAPALNPLPCFTAERAGDRVVVHRKPAGASIRKAPPPRPPSSVVIVGGGPAGAACAETLRKEGYDGPVTLVAGEPPGPVDRPNLSKDYLAGNAPEEWLPLRGAEFYAEQKITFLVEDPAERLDVAGHQVTLRSGRVLPYGALVLAPGAQPRRLPVPGGDHPHVFTLRTVADSRAIIARAATARRVVVVGASFIGLEVAAALRTRNLEVDVVGPENVPLARVVGDELGAFVRALHEEHGVRFHLGTGVTAVHEHEVALADARRLPADLVVVGIGVTPITALAEQAGLEVDNGIVVDERLRASAPDVYAAGDAARVPDARVGDRVRIEPCVVAERQGQAAARSLLGREAPYRDVPFFWSQHYDVTVAYVGHAPRWDRIERRGNLAARDFAAFYLRDRRVLALATVGRDQLSLRTEAALEAGDENMLTALLGEA
jgi:NADPH-dependent 2,4-dienoyl-CoA reductase/sulfur reductase-like enzyme/nitrite reductase/ring-hydroxylating ferredoxin subunit